MTTMEIIMTTFEIIYYLTAGPLLVFIAIKGLRQISVAKEINKTNSQREAFRLAAEQCNLFKDDIIPLYRNFKIELNETQNKFFQKYEILIDSKNIQCKTKGNIDKDDIEKINNSKYLTDLINALEGYSIYFASGIASEKVGFITTGQTFCKTVEELLPILVPEFKKGFYKNISIVFLMWHNRIENEKLKIEKAEIDRKLKDNKTISISPIGMTEK